MTFIRWFNAFDYSILNDRMESELPKKHISSLPADSIRFLSSHLKGLSKSEHLPFIAENSTAHPCRPSRNDLKSLRIRFGMITILELSDLEFAWSFGPKFLLESQWKVINIWILWILWFLCQHNPFDLHNCMIQGLHDKTREMVREQWYDQSKLRGCWIDWSSLHWFSVPKVFGSFESRSSCLINVDRIWAF